MAAKRWDANKIVKIGTIDGDFTCVGKTKESRRCGNRISKASRSEAKQILQEMSSLDLNSGEFEEMVDDLASICLCTKNLQSQQGSKAKEWQILIDNAAETARKYKDMMGEASDTEESLLRQLDDVVGRLKLVSCSPAPVRKIVEEVDP